MSESVFSLVRYRKKGTSGSCRSTSYRSSGLRCWHHYLGFPVQEEGEAEGNNTRYITTILFTLAFNLYPSIHFGASSWQVY
jgi:hypothetical protein